MNEQRLNTVSDVIGTIFVLVFAAWILFAFSVGARWCFDQIVRIVERW